MFYSDGGAVYSKSNKVVSSALLRQVALIWLSFGLVVQVLSAGVGSLLTFGGIFSVALGPLALLFLILGLIKFVFTVLFLGGLVWYLFFRRSTSS